MKKILIGLLILISLLISCSSPEITITPETLHQYDGYICMTSNYGNPCTIILYNSKNNMYKKYSIAIALKEIYNKGDTLGIESYLRKLNEKNQVQKSNTNIKIKKSNIDIDYE